MNLKKISIQIEKKYLVLPVCEDSEVKKLLFYQNNKLVFDLDIRLAAPEQGCTKYYINLERFGESVDIAVEPDMDFEFGFADSDHNDTIYNEEHRPLVHFSAKRGWINDPNGLVEYISPVTGKKTYHMFFQHNPCSVKWGNMHWGHAVSDDLIHWNQLDCALYPDEFGTMYSGSAIVDKDNKSGLKTGDENVILFYYTAAGKNSRLSENSEFTQCLAYSSDGGVTFTKYEKNPIIPHIIGGNRDPKVIWCNPLGCYVLALYLDGNTYGLFTSDNLIDWTEIQEIPIDGDSECPDFYPLICDDDGKEKWILSGASHCYIIGDIADGKFVPSQSVKRLHYGTNSYASQTFSDISDGRRINVAWDTVTIPDSIFNCQMGVPAEHTLKMKDGEYFLCANPIREFASLRNKNGGFFSASIKGNLSSTLTPSYELIFTGDDIGCDAVIKFSIYGKEFICDLKNNELSCSDRKSPLSLIDGKFNLRLICDRDTIEIYAGLGEVYHTFGHIAENTEFTVSIGNISTGNSTLNIIGYPLNSIW